MEQINNPVVNINHIRLRDMELLFRGEIDKCDMENKIVSFATDDTEQFVIAYNSLQKSASGSQLLLIEDVVYLIVP